MTCILPNTIFFIKKKKNIIVKTCTFYFNIVMYIINVNKLLIIILVLY